jgi:fructose-1,6-bisphosphatase
MDGHGRAVPRCARFRKADIIAEVLIEANLNKWSPGRQVPEEMDSIYVVPHRCLQVNSLPMFDPPDGSSNIDAVNVSIGTIFSVLKRPANPMALRKARISVQAGSTGGAGYCVYGPARDQLGADWRRSLRSRWTVRLAPLTEENVAIP